MSDSSCAFEGNTDMYGLGIRLAFYLQWFGSILAAWIARSEVPNFAFSNTVFISATFLALIIQTVRHNLKPVEIYIILLLCFGGYLSYVPLFAWRLLTRGDPRYDPTRWPRVETSEISSRVGWTLLVAVSSFQLWFWFSEVPTLNNELGCQEFGFLFSKIALNNKGFVAVNIVFQFLLLLCCVIVLFMIAGVWKERKFKGRVRSAQRLALQKMLSLNNIIIASIVTAATELTIHWNSITGVNSLSSAGQLIPFLVGLSLVLRVLYVYWKEEEEPPKGGTGSSSYGSGSGGTHAHSTRPGGGGSKGPAGTTRLPPIAQRLPAPVTRLPPLASFNVGRPRHR